MLNLIPTRKAGTLMNSKDIFDRFFDDFFNEDFVGNMTSRRNLGMRVDIKDNGDKYEIVADLPGFKKEDISVEVKENNLIITAKNEETNEQSGDRFIRKERSYGEVKRSFYLGDVRTEDIEAKYENGVLNIKLSKAEEEQPKLIEVK